MEYQNVKTGFILNTDCKIAGADWVPVNGETITLVQPTAPTVETPAPVAPVQPAPVAPVQPAPVTVDSADDGFDGITVKQIKQELDAFGVEYDPKAKKQVLYDLMMAQHG